MLPAANQVGCNPETNRSPLHHHHQPPLSSVSPFFSFSRNERSWGGAAGRKEGGCLREIKTYSREEERGREGGEKQTQSNISSVLSVQTELSLPDAKASFLFFLYIYLSHFIYLFIVQMDCTESVLDFGLFA